MKALIVIDVQNDFMPGGPLEVTEGDRIVPVINRMLEKFHLIVATQDWHPSQHQSFASAHPGKKAFDTIMLEGIEQTLWPDHCVQGTDGADFHPDLDTRPFDAIIRKGMNPVLDSYSGFYDNQRRNSTGLAGLLHEKNVKELYFCGLAADVCVYYSIKDALTEHFHCYLLEDATRPLDKQQFEDIKKELLQKKVNIISKDEIVA